MADQRDVAEVQLLHERGNIRGIVSQQVPGGRRVGPAMAAHGDREHTISIRQVRQHELEGAPRVADAVQKDNRHAIGLSLRDVLKRNARGELDLRRGRFTCDGRSGEREEHEYESGKAKHGGSIARTLLTECFLSLGGSRIRDGGSGIEDQHST
jgi:hypothetical protein